MESTNFLFKKTCAIVAKKFYYVISLVLKFWFQVYQK